MSLMWIFYWIDVIAKISVFLKIISVAFLIAGVYCFIFYFSEDSGDGEIKYLKKYSFILFFSGCFILLISLFMPSKETSYKMVASYAAQEVYESPQAKEIGNKLIVLANKKLDDLLKEESKEK